MAAPGMRIMNRNGRTASTLLTLPTESKRRKTESGSAIAPFLEANKRWAAAFAEENSDLLAKFGTAWQEPPILVSLLCNPNGDYDNGMMPSMRV